uniref:Uncharacterized protein n=1 Tax=Zonotrichia albicollis TaxID=44394 RepID=A0A8D2MB31_ZONAL
MCLVFCAFASWAVKTSDLQAPDAWKTSTYSASLERGGRALGDVGREEKWDIYTCSCLWGSAAFPGVPKPFPCLFSPL